MKKLLLLALLSAFCFQLSAFGQTTGGTYRHEATGTAVSGAVTMTALSGYITTESLTTAAGAAYTLTMTNAHADATHGSIVHVGVENGTNTQGTPDVGSVTIANGTITIKILNLHATQAFNGTLLVCYDFAP